MKGEGIINISIHIAEKIMQTNLTIPNLLMTSDNHELGLSATEHDGEKTVNEEKAKKYTKTRI